MNLRAQSQLLLEVDRGREPFVEPGRRPILSPLDDGEFTLFYGCDDGLGQRLSVFFLDHGLDVRAVELLGEWVVRFVVVEDDGV